MFEVKIKSIKYLIKTNLSIYYLSILLDILLDILEKEPLAHKDNIIKFDISIICELFHEKNEILYSSNSFFYSCVNELLEKYKITLPEKMNLGKIFLKAVKKNHMKL